MALGQGLMRSTPGTATARTSNAAAGLIPSETRSSGLGALRISKAPTNSDNDLAAKSCPDPSVTSIGKAPNARAASNLFLATRLRRKPKPRPLADIALSAGRKTLSGPHFSRKHPMAWLYRAAHAGRCSVVPIEIDDQTLTYSHIAAGIARRSGPRVWLPGQVQEPIPGLPPQDGKFTRKDTRECLSPIYLRENAC
jgi:hypothetical protein